MVKFDEALDFDAETKKNVTEWLQGDYDATTKAEIERLLRENPQEIIDAFYTHLEFGTAGLRGIMGVGTNRMNRYTVCAATQGLANYLKLQPEKNLSVFIGYDSRHNSRYFAEEAAKVLAGNGIKVYITSDIRPTPLVSFGVRHLKCSAGIMITASHNPPQYNGYKVYWNDGGQVLPPHDKGIIEEANKIKDISMVISTPTLQNEFIKEVGEDVDKAYYAAITPLQNYPTQNRQFGNQLRIVYTSLHGTGITLIKEALARWGFPNIIYVDKQIIPDGNFPTALYPNPEDRHALDLGIELLEKEQADLLIATDPDADRVGIAVRHKGETIILNGNQIASVLMEHVCEALTSQNLMPPDAAFIKSLVTTELMQAIADYYKRPLFNVLTGFKYIAQLIREWETTPNGHKYIFGGEESYGYLLGTQTRDKDAITASCLICEAALNTKLKNKTLVDMFNDLFKKYGLYFEKVIPIPFDETKAGREKMKAGMQRLRENPPAGVVLMEDYLKGIKTDLKTNISEKMVIPKADILAFWLENGSKVMIRPSGTEPKVKIYYGIVNKDKGSLAERQQQAEIDIIAFTEVIKKNFSYI